MHPVVRASPSCKTAAVLPEGSHLTIYSVENGKYSNPVSINSDFVDFCFLPQRYGEKFISANSHGALSLWSKKKDAWAEDTIDGTPEFSSCLRISTFDAQTVLGFISNGSVQIFELTIDEEISVLSIRKYRHPLAYISFDFGTYPSIWCLTSTELHMYSLNCNLPKAIYTLPHSAVMVAANKYLKESAAVLSDDGFLMIQTMSQQIIIEHTVEGAFLAAWSPLGSSISIEGNTSAEFSEVSPGIWTKAVSDAESSS